MNLCAKVNIYHWLVCLSSPISHLSERLLWTKVFFYVVDLGIQRWKESGSVLIQRGRRQNQRSCWGRSLKEKMLQSRSSCFKSSNGWVVWRRVRQQVKRKLLASGLRYGAGCQVLFARAHFLGSMQEVLCNILVGWCNILWVMHLFSEMHADFMLIFCRQL